MLDRIRPRLTYANVMATIAVFGVLAGGGAYAASKIGPKDIKKNAVRAKHIKNKQVKGADINPRAKAMWAAVNADGEIENQSGGITITEQSNPRYSVKFPRSLQGKAIVATPIASSTLARPTNEPPILVRPCGGVVDPESVICTFEGVGNTPRNAIVLADDGFYIAALP